MDFSNIESIKQAGFVGFKTINDLFIDWNTIQHSLPLVTRDKHFEHIKSVETIYW